MTWLEVVTEVDFWVSLHKFENIGCALVVFIDISVSEIIIDGILLVLPVGVKTIASTDDYVKNDLAIIVDLFSASLDGRNKIGIPNGTSVHEDMLTPIVMWEHSRNKG